ncbi:hypothetical protein [Paracoccus fistulariae]|uniref:H-NS histone family protein n=1 Tax=Paracoccus fistulariae TaxID=658446 RepID=A0ABY7SIE9_9RHOB|nr:hypothetical protein [Paracoccus fistulariae]MDB6181978.1 hypothetical protein [Paracoccus fistulariae]WCR06785.1 hypothetical protein JHX87_15100 [Paracoccus fistulariae]
MENLKHLLTQREEIDRKIAADAEEQVAEIKTLLEHLCKVTGKNMYELLSLKEPVKTRNRKKASNQDTPENGEWKKFKKENDGKAFMVDGESITLKNKGPNNNKLYSAWKRGSLVED